MGSLYVSMDSMYVIDVRAVKTASARPTPRCRPHCSPPLGPRAGRCWQACFKQGGDGVQGEGVSIYACTYTDQSSD